MRSSAAFGALMAVQAAVARPSSAAAIWECPSSIDNTGQKNVSAALTEWLATTGRPGDMFRLRRNPGYAPYDELDFSIPVFTEGDVNARVWVRIREVEASLSLVQQILDKLPEGPIHTRAIPMAGQGMALVESFRGEIMTWVAVRDDGIVTRCHPRDPSWFQWPLLEAAIEGNIVADFPLCNKSFNCSYSGHDL